jgi:hypothetical protein
MTKREIEAVLLSITYKPGWRLRWWFERDLLNVAVCYTAPNAAPPHEKIALSRTEAFDLAFLRHAPKENLPGLIEDVIREMEVHEMHEWLRVNGKPLRHPVHEHVG